MACLSEKVRLFPRLTARREAVLRKPNVSEHVIVLLMVTCYRCNDCQESLREGEASRPLDLSGLIGKDSFLIEVPFFAGEVSCQDLVNRYYCGSLL